jgi:elongation factor P
VGTISINQIKVGVTIDVEGAPFLVTNVEHVKPGKGSAFVRTKLRNMKSDLIIERTYKSDDKIEEAYIEERALQYSYQSGDFYHFIDTETYEDVAIEHGKLRSQDKFLKDEIEVVALYYNKELVIVNLPNFVIYTIKHTEPGIKGDTAKGGFKPATLETGAVIQVPLFVEPGTRVKVDTRTGEYIERAV